jgi:hypothetical protein
MKLDAPDWESLSYLLARPLANDFALLHHVVVK